MKARVRDRIFETACNLFYSHGIHGVGVEMIVAEAGSNKMSFYRSFASKDALVAEYLREQERAYWVWWDATVARYPDDPRRQIEALFEAQMEIAMSNGCRGCALGNAAAEISDGEDELSALVHSYKERVRKRLRAMARAVGARDAEILEMVATLLAVRRKPPMDTGGAVDGEAGVWQAGRRKTNASSGSWSLPLY